VNPISILFCDIDDTLTGTLSGHKFKKSPDDIVILPGVKKGLELYANKGWLIVGISNQGGIEKGYKSLGDTIIEMQNTIRALPQIQSIFFCPDFDGIHCYQVLPKSTQHFGIETIKLLGAACDYRKPSQGMVVVATSLIEKANPTKEVNPKFCEFIGDRPEDEQCATNAQIPYKNAFVWRAKYQ
jgi:D-glycero-D-manno-heptose 1,7-bisphosphate phosphatase